jgi:hypothetical protein
LTFFIHPNQCLFFFHDPEELFTAARMKQVFAEGVIIMEGDVEPFSLKWGNKGPTLYASIDHGKTVKTLVKRLMRQISDPNHRVLAEASNACIEVKFEDAEEVLDDINTLIEVQATLQKATNALMYNSWNQSFNGPEDLE